MKNKNRTEKTVVQLAKKIIEYGGEQICSLLFPLRCPVCDELLSPEDAEKGIHLKCESKFYPVEGAVCMHCGRPLGQFLSHEERKKRKQIFEVENSREYCAECCRKGYVKVESGVKEKRCGNAEGYVAANGYMNAKSYDREETKLLSDIIQGKSLYLYKGAIKKTMYRFKYSNKREYAKFFAAQAVQRYGDWIKAEAIIPVPMYSLKEKQRGYNQAEVFAKELSRLTGIPVDSKLVRRVRNTAPQKGLNHIERENNLKKAFQIEKSIVKYSCVLIIDDIFTTGCTAEAVAKELKKRGVRQIYCMSICIGGDT